MTTATAIPTPTLSEAKQKTEPHRRLFTVDELFAMLKPASSQRMSASNCWMERFL